MSFCGQCGAEITPNSTFCGKCGSKVESGNQQGAVSDQGAPKGRNKTIGMIAVGAIAVIALFFLVNVIGAIGTPGHEKPLKHMIKAMNSGSYKQFVKAFPDYMVDKFDDTLDYLYDDDMDKFMESFTDDLKDEYGKNYKITYKVTDKEKLDKDDIEELEDDIKYMYDKKVKIKSAYVLETDLKIKGKKGSDSNDTEIVVYKIGSKWYMDSSSMGF